MAAALRSQLVGRATELDVAREALASARAGEGKLVFVHGEAGIGKTRLCQELRATQDSRRTQVLAGRADPGDAATMFSAVADALRAARRTEPNLWAAVQHRQETLAAVVPELVSRSPGRMVVDRSAGTPLLVEELVATFGAEYPSLWPETIRALLVHSAEWTPAMHAQFDAAGSSRRAREALIRRYGFGVPSSDRALRSAGDALTLVLQDTIRPFEDSRLREMHTHDLPWPTAALEDLAEAPVRLRVTLSYFIEPNPTRRGWKRRYRYASHGLRFELKQPSETNDDFHKRLNKRALDEEEGRPTGGDTGGWYLGSQARTRGSLHVDFWDGTAIELASRGRLAVFPVTGWWKEQASRDRSDLGARYALVLSIQTPVETADLWTPVAQQVGLPITIVT